MRRVAFLWPCGCLSSSVSYVEGQPRFVLPIEQIYASLQVCSTLLGSMWTGDSQFRSTFRKERDWNVARRKNRSSQHRKFWAVPARFSWTPSGRSARDRQGHGPRLGILFGRVPLFFWDPPHPILFHSGHPSLVFLQDHKGGRSALRPKRDPPRHKEARGTRPGERLAPLLREHPQFTMAQEVGSTTGNLRTHVFLFCFCICFSLFLLLLLLLLKAQC